MSNLPTPIFPYGVDDPIVQDANFKQNKPFVTYIDGAIRRLMSALFHGGTTAIYGGLYQTSAVLSLPTSFAQVLVPFNTVSIPKKNTISVITPSNSITVSVPGDIIVTAGFTFNTSSTATGVGINILRNGVALPDAVSQANTAGTTDYKYCESSALVTAAAGDVFTVTAYATSNTVSLTYSATFFITNAGNSQGLPGATGPSGGTNAQFYVNTSGGGSYVATPFFPPAVNATVSNDVSAGNTVNTITNGSFEGQRLKIVIENQNANGTGYVDLPCAANNLFIAAAASQPANTFRVAGSAGTSLEMTWQSQSNAGSGGWYAG